MSTSIKIIILISVAIVLYGFYEKERRASLLKEFKENKGILCDDTIVQRAAGWKIHNNRFFTNGSVMKTIVFCKSMNK